MLTEKEISFKIEKLYQSKLFSALELLQILKMLAGFKHSVRLIFENDQKTSKRIKLFDLLKIPCERVIYRICRYSGSQQGWVEQSLLKLQTNINAGIVFKFMQAGCQRSCHSRRIRR